MVYMSLIKQIQDDRNNKKISCIIYINIFFSFHFLFFIILFYFILFYFILFILFYFILFYFILFYFILFYFILFYFILFYFILFYFILFYFILFYFILFYFILFCPFLLFKFKLNLRLSPLFSFLGKNHSLFLLELPILFISFISFSFPFTDGNKRVNSASPLHLCGFLI